MDHLRLESNASTVSMRPVVEKEDVPTNIVGVSSQESSIQLNSGTQLNEVNGYEYTAYNFSTKKKWWILTVVALCQTSMNFNAAIYSNAVKPLNEHYGITRARDGMAAFLITYAFGCEFWAPWSEEFGRWIVMQTSLFFINVWQPLAGASTSWNMVLASRVMGGFSTAGGSVTLGMVADMFDPEEQQHAVLWASFCGFSDALIFSFLESYGIVFGQWNFNPTQFSLAMFALLIGYCVAYFSFFPVIRHHNHLREMNDPTLTPESRLWWLLFLAPLLPIGLLGSAFVVTGPPLPCSRDLLAGLCAFYTGPMYKSLGTQNSTFLLFGVSFLVCIPVYVFYWKGPKVRERSKWAEKVKIEQVKMSVMRAQTKERRGQMKV
ncbi:hypothetical protein N0V90_013291 [Kalmusia sp. IMI 367209]|nr:hypothetical protein N0V90_013291 [Kalmusia sp. IMI 367209]